MDFQEIVNLHEKIYQTNIQYKIDYDEKTMIEEKSKVSVRMFITTSKPKEPAKELELILIASYKENKLYRVWELTFPDWSQDAKFKDVLENNKR